MHTICVCVLIQDRKRQGPSQSLSHCWKHRWRCTYRWPGAVHHLQDACSQIPLWYSELQSYLQVYCTHWWACFCVLMSIWMYVLWWPLQFLIWKNTYYKVLLCLSAINSQFYFYLPPQSTKYCLLSITTLKRPQSSLTSWFRPSTSGCSLTWESPTHVSTSLTSNKAQLFTQ